MSSEPALAAPAPSAAHGPRRAPAFDPGEIEQPVFRRFEAIARAHPERVAVRMPGGRRTYRELNAEANRIAWRLLRDPGDRGRPVVLWLEPGPALFAAMLGVLKAGRFYVPLDPALPEARLRATLAEADADLILTDRGGVEEAARAAGLSTRVERVDEAADSGPCDDPSVPVQPGDLAYILFTSGSTGTPKGVMQSHRNLLHNVFKLTNGLGIAPEDRLTLLSSASFGASVSDVYGALLNGAAVCPFPLRGDGLLRLRFFLVDEEITILHCVPSLFRQLAAMLDGTEDLSRLRMVKLGGEPVLRSDFELYRERFPRGCLFHVGLGSTEVSIIRQWFADHDSACPAPIAPLGYPVDGTEVVLLDEHGRATDAGTGEIALVSRTLALGYWKRPELTAEAFTPVPGRGGERMFRTGDIGTLLPDGCLLYVGRKDSRVKIRGHRVELAEVEAALAALPAVSEAAVATREGAAGTRLVAYVVAKKAPHPGADALRRELADRLPEPMIPSLFVFLEALPRTAGGKVDRNALPEPGSARPELETPFAEPGDAAERRVAEIFAELLRVDRVGAADDFFDLGGDSLAVVEALLRLNEAFGQDLSVTDFIEASTPAGLAARLRSGATASPSALVALQKGSDRPPVFLVPGGTGDGEDLLVVARLVRFLGSEHTVFGFRSGPPPHGSLTEKAAAYVARMKAVAPEGPYFLVGECVGGILAHAMAAELSSRGEDVALLALLDTPFPNARRRLLHRLHWLREPWGDNLVRRLRHHGRTVGRLESGRLRYLVDKARSAARALTSLGRRAQRSRARMRAAYVGALLAARPTRFRGPVHLILSEERRSQATASAWAPLADRLTVAECAGDHHTYIRDHVVRVAEVLRGWLDESLERSRRAGATPGA
jgi:amino acid adenylation domain-containing protein